MKPKIRKINKNHYSCRGLGEISHGTNAWSAYRGWIVITFQPKITKLVTCMDCVGIGEKLIPDGFYTKRITCEGCNGLGCGT
jgi:hypothetical protein